MQIARSHPLIAAVAADERRPQSGRRGAVAQPSELVITPAVDPIGDGESAGMRDAGAHVKKPMVTGDWAGRETVGRGTITELPQMVGSPTIGTVIRGNATGELDALVHLSKRERRGGGEGRGGFGTDRRVGAIVAAKGCGENSREQETRHGRRWSDQNGERWAPHERGGGRVPNTVGTMSQPPQASLKPRLGCHFQCLSCSTQRYLIT